MKRTRSRRSLSQCIHPSLSLRSISVQVLNRRKHLPRYSKNPPSLSFIDYFLLVLNPFDILYAISFLFVGIHCLVCVCLVKRVVLKDSLVWIVMHKGEASKRLHLISPTRICRHSEVPVLSQQQSTTLLVQSV